MADLMFETAKRWRMKCGGYVEVSSTEFGARIVLHVHGKSRIFRSGEEVSEFADAFMEAVKIAKQVGFDDCQSLEERESDG